VISRVHSVLTLFIVCFSYHLALSIKAHNNDSRLVVGGAGTWPVVEGADTWYIRAVG
jgi:hypothetical protein